MSSGNGNNNSSYNNAWRQNGGMRDQLDSASYGEIVTDRITIKEGIVGDLNIGGTIYADNLLISGATLINDDMELNKNLSVHGNTQTQTLGVSGLLSANDDLHVRKKLRLGVSSSSQYLWSDGVSGVAVNAGEFPSGSLPSGGPVPASFFVAGANPCALAATTTALHTRNILAQTGAPAKSGLAVESGGVAVVGVSGSSEVVADPALDTGFTELQFYAGGSVSAQHVDHLGGTAAAVDDDLGRLRYEVHTLTAQARHLVLAGGASGTTILGSASGAALATAAADVAALEVRARPRGTAPAAPYNEPWLAGRIGASSSSSMFADTPLRVTPADNADDDDAHVFAYLGSANRGWRAAGGGPAMDDRDPGDMLVALTASPPGSSTYLAQPDPARLPVLGPSMIDNPVVSGRLIHNKRSASHAGFLEPGLGPSGLAQFVPVLTQTQAPGRLQNRGMVAVNAPLARAHNQAAMFVNGPTHLQMLDAAPLSLATPFVNLGSSAAGVRPAWDSAALPDDMYLQGSGRMLPDFAPDAQDVNGQFGLVLGGRSSSTENFPVYRTADGGQTWTEGEIQGSSTVFANTQFSATIFGPRHALAYSKLRGFAFLTTDGGVTWSNKSTVLSGTTEDPTVYPLFAYAVPGRNRLYYTRGRNLYLRENFAANDPLPSAVKVGDTQGISVDGGLVGTVLDYETTGNAPATALVAFSNTSNVVATFVLALPNEANGGSGLALLYNSPAGKGFTAAAASTLAGGRCARDVVLAGRNVDTGNLVVLVSNPNETVSPVTDWARANTIGGFWTEVVVAVPSSSSAYFQPVHAAWIHPQVIVLSGDENSSTSGGGSLAVSADRGRTWRFVGGLPTATSYHDNPIARSGLAAVLGPLAAFPRMCGVFRSAALPHTARGRRGGPLPPLVLVAASGSSTTTTAAAAAAAFALSLDSLVPRFAPLLQVDGSALVEGCMDVEQTLDVTGDTRVQHRLFANSIDVLVNGQDELRIGCGEAYDITYAAANSAGGNGTVSPESVSAKFVRIGRAGDTIVFQGNVRQEGTVTVANKTVTVNNENDTEDYGFQAGLQVYENGVANAGYVQTTLDRRGWDIRAPGSSTIARIALDVEPSSGTPMPDYNGTVRAAVGAPKPLVAVWTASGTTTAALGARTGLAAEDVMLRKGVSSTATKQIVDSDLELESGRTFTATTIGSRAYTQQVAANNVSANNVYATNVGTVGARINRIYVSGLDATGDQNENYGYVNAYNFNGTNMTTRYLFATNIFGKNGLNDIVQIIGVSSVLATSVSADLVSANRVRGGNMDTSGTVSANLVSANTVAGGNIQTVGTVSADLVSANRVRGGNMDTSGTVSANLVSANTVAGGNIQTTGTVSADLVSANRVRGGNMDTSGTVSANLVSANTVAGGNIQTVGTVSADLVSANRVRGGNMDTSGTVSANLVSATTVSAGTARGLLVEVGGGGGNDGTASNGRTAGLQGVGGGRFRVSGAVHPGYEFFGVSGTSMVNTDMAGTLAGAIGGSGSAYADMNYIHLGGPSVSANDRAAPAHTWRTNNVLTGDTKVIAQLMRNGDLNVPLGGVVALTTVSAAAVAATGSVTAGSVTATTGAVTAQSLNITGNGAGTKGASVTNGNLTVGGAGNARTAFCNQFSTQGMNVIATKSAVLQDNKLTLAGGVSTDVLVDCTGRVSAASVSATSVAAMSLTAPGVVISGSSNVGRCILADGYVSARFIEAIDQLTAGRTTTGASVVAVGYVSANSFRGATYTNLEATIAQFSPVGTVLDYVGASAPNTSWRIMNGQQLLNAVNDFRALWDIVPNGWKNTVTNVLTLPDLRGRVVLGADNADGTGVPTNNLTARSFASTGGKETHKLLPTEMPKHTHAASAGTGFRNAGFDRYVTAGFSGAETGIVGGEVVNGNFSSSTKWPGAEHTHAITVQDAGADVPHENMPPWYALNKIIKVV